MRLGKLEINGIVCIEVPACSTLVSQSRAFDLVRDGPWEQVRVNFWSLVDKFVTFMVIVIIGPGKLPIMLGAKLHIFDAKMDQILVGNCIFLGF